MGWQVGHVAVGDLVWTATRGTLCQYVLAEGSEVFLSPRHLEASGASTVPFSGLTTLGVLSKDCKLDQKSAEGKSVFVVDGTSATGCLAIQLLKSWGAQVVTVVPYRVVPLAKMMGAEYVIPTMPDHLDTEENCSAELLTIPLFDVILLTSPDLLSVEFCQKYIKPGGHVATTCPELREKLNQLSDIYGFLQFWTRLFSRKSRRSISAVDDTFKILNYSNLNHLKSLVENGTVKPVLDSVYPLERAVEAFQHVMTEQTVGKTVIKFEDEEKRSRK